MNYLPMVSSSTSLHLHTVGIAVKSELKALFVAARHAVRAHRLKYLVMAILLAGGGLLVHTFDHPLDDRIRDYREASAVAVALASALRDWGKGVDTAFFAFSVMAIAVARRSRSLMRYGYACIIAALVTGIVINVVRVGTGRPRPRAEMPDRWTGPTLIYRHQSFPSGHTSAAFATAGALLLTTPGWGMIALCSATGVGWSSLVSRAHYASDVWVGMLTGLSIGSAAGAGARRLNRRLAKH